MKTKLIAYLLTFLICFAFAMPVVLAQVNIEGTLKNTATGIYGQGEEPTSDLPVIIGKIINIVLSFMGVVLVLIVIYGGFLYMTAGGESKNTDKGKSYIVNGIIGMIIVLSAYGITTFVVTRLTEATGTVAG